MALRKIYTLADTLNVQKIIYVNDALTVNDFYTTAAGNDSNSGLSPSKPLASITAALALVSGSRGCDSGLMAAATWRIYGEPRRMMECWSSACRTATRRLAGAITVNATSDVTLQSLDIADGATANGGNSLDFVNDIGGAISIVGSSEVLLTNDVVAGLTLTNGTSAISVLDSSILGTGLSINGSTTGLLVSDSTLASLTLGAVSQGVISDNNIAGGGLGIDAAFTGSIDHNRIDGATVGVMYAASAPLNNNEIYGNKTGVVDTVNSNTVGLGFAADSNDNEIFGNAVGVNLTGLMQNQSITANTIGVTGSGVLGGTSLDSANLIQDNATGIQFTGTIQYDDIDRNTVSIAVQNNQLIAHNVIYDNVGPNLETTGASNVEIDQITRSIPRARRISKSMAALRTWRF